MSIPKTLLLILSSTLIFQASCNVNPVSLLTGGLAGSDDDNSGISRSERDVSGTLSLALGGVRETTDAYTPSSNQELLDVQVADPDLFSITLGRNTATIHPRQVGIGYFTPIISGQTTNPIEVTIPPQSLIQILIAEARGQLDAEATRQDNEVKVSSSSITGEAIASVIRNRVQKIMDDNNPSLFNTDENLFFENPPTSSFEAVIEASNRGIFQFSPVDPLDTNHSYYTESQTRDRLEVYDSDALAAYDQAVITSAGIYNDRIEDPTGNAFGYYSPTPSEYAALKIALDSHTTDFPEDVGTSESNFPALAPIQILIIPKIAPSHVDKNVPSFVFIRSRTANEPAVSN